MDTRSLRLFLNLAETLHFGRSSEACHVSPSTLSRAIKQLEESLGVELFLRDNRRVELTAEGNRFAQYARETLQQWEQIRHSLLEGAGELRGEISVYCSVTASYSFLYSLLSRFRHLYPQVEIKLHTGDPEHAVARVQSGREEISIAARPAQLPSGIAFRPLDRTPLLFIAPVEQTLNQNDWRRQPMILPESGISRERINQWFASQQIQPDIYAQVTGNEAIVSMVSLGFGIGVVPQIVLENSPLADRVEVLPVEPALEPYEIGLFAQERKLRSPIIHAFWSLLDPEPDSHLEPLS
ncbi:HTH-type transcriptional activator IlvY [Marinobacterium sediminicola]|uniref:LysR family transcriptional regulator, positive regulator for ilvC n=1 Tax=Marinobacterium sediminicola TaxID=518898 RepID=A0ABY1S4T8_9GAMM|nr:HTH-type transcriptional activator IlvY [Marinobacterium sediminicola]ULG68941.1 HTH-type transcriptional activator IlvY [Marinobacterium sediminicola]SMR78444.1 LysR family transcriptional regulator, positive regulator for ilvC [Marinobacterium sediminicola]